MLSTQREHRSYGENGTCYFWECQRDWNPLLILILLSQHISILYFLCTVPLSNTSLMEGCSGEAAKKTWLFTECYEMLSISQIQELKTQHYCSPIFITNTYSQCFPPWQCPGSASSPGCGFSPEKDVHGDSAAQHSEPCIYRGAGCSSENWLLCI